MNITVEEDVEPELLELHHHWGEIPVPGPSLAPALPPELEHGSLAIMRMKITPKTKLPIAEDTFDPNSLVLPPDDSLTTEILKHNIRLNKHIKDMGRLIRDIEKDPTKVKECPPIPVIVKSKRVDRPGQPDNAVDAKRIRLSRTQSLPAVVDDDVIQKMLEKSVIMILAQMGFDRAEKQALLVFVDVVKDMLHKVALMSHELNQKDVIEGKAAYKDVLEKAFRSVGFSGLDCVKEYFKKTLLAKRKLALQKSKQLMLIYSQKVAEASKRTGNVPGNVLLPALHIAPTIPVPEYSPSTSTMSEPLQ